MTRRLLMTSASMAALLMAAQRPADDFDGWYGALDDGYHIINDDFSDMNWGRQ